MDRRPKSCDGQSAGVVVPVCPNGLDCRGSKALELSRRLLKLFDRQATHACSRAGSGRPLRSTSGMTIPWAVRRSEQDAHRCSKSKYAATRAAYDFVECVPSRLDIGGPWSRTASGMLYMGCQGQLIQDPESLLGERKKTRPCFCPTLNLVKRPRAPLV